VDIDYYWDGKLAPKVHITGKLVDRLSGYSLIKKDLDNALKWMRLAKALANEHRPAGEGAYLETKNRDVFDLVKAYFVASVTFYAKCFTETARRHAQASRAWLDPGFLSAHDSCMSYRNNLAAHSGDKEFELAKTYVLINPEEGKKTISSPTSRQYECNMTLL